MTAYELNTHEYYMKLAIDEAIKGVGNVNPNPLVGAIIVKDGTIISCGYHARYGDLHAERTALATVKATIQGATMYVTLEPCCHYGKQPPCTEAIIASGITKVYIGSSDPNPLVAGKGVEILRNHGIEVVENLLKEECDKINYVFFHYIKTGTPYVVMKYAMTADGKIATHTGKSQWITGAAARHKVQEDRHRYSGIMVGIGTVLKDNPLLTCRLPNGNSPTRIICDSKLRIPLQSQIVSTAKEFPTIIAYSPELCTSNDEQESSQGNVSQESKLTALQHAGCTTLPLPAKDGHIDLNVLMTKLGEMKIDSILLEGGGQLNWSALNSGIVQRVQTYIAPKLFGGKDAPTSVSGQGVETPDNAIKLSKPSITIIDNDILLESEVIKCSQE